MTRRGRFSKPYKENLLTSIFQLLKDCLRTVVGFGCTKRPCAARTRLFRIIKTQALSVPPAHLSSAISYSRKIPVWRKIRELKKALIKDRQRPNPKYCILAMHVHSLLCNISSGLSWYTEKGFGGRLYLAAHNVQGYLRDKTISPDM